MAIPSYTSHLASACSKTRCRMHNPAINPAPYPAQMRELGQARHLADF